MRGFKISVITSLLVSGLSASGLSLYEDPTTHQIYTEAGEGRVKLGNFVDEMSVKDSLSSSMKKEAGVELKSKATKLEFSGTHYLGYVYSDWKDKQDSSKFETRRNYIQTKAYLNDKDYLRVTLDSYQETKGNGIDSDGSWLTRFKYAYLYLDNILPYTGVEIGQVHRAWIDYEEHAGWWYRSISKVLVEDSTGAGLINSADLGVNFKTKMDYFSSELAIVNGEGYHSLDGSNEQFDLSVEWRLTGHIFGTGKKKADRNKDEYFDVSFWGLKSDNHSKSVAIDSAGNKPDLTLMSLHTVYNNPMFLLSAQYTSANDDEMKYDGKGYSVNGEYRPMKDWTVLGRYDNWDESETIKKPKGVNGGDREQYIYGVSYQYNKYVNFIANAKTIDFSDKAEKANEDKTEYYLTAEVHW